MNKKYREPSVEVIELTGDIITTSVLLDKPDIEMAEVSILGLGSAMTAGYNDSTKGQ